MESSQNKSHRRARMRDMPAILRPRERLRRYGAGKLSNSELLAIILRTGRQGENATRLAGRVLVKFSASGLQKASFEELSLCEGIGTAKACEIIASLELGKRLSKGKKAVSCLVPKDVWKAMRDVRNNKKEHFIVFYLDVHSEEIVREVVSVGTLTASIVHPREVFEPAIRNNASAVILAHNHPSQNPAPSEDDVRITKRLIEAGDILGIEVIDHVIVSRDKFFSFKDRGMM